MGDSKIGSSLPLNIPSSIDSQSEISTSGESAVGATKQEAVNKVGFETRDHLEAKPLKTDLDDMADLQKMLQEVDPNQPELRTPGQVTRQVFERGRMQSVAQLGAKIAAPTGGQVATPKAAPTAPPKDGLAPGKSISAKVTHDQEGFHFDFDRPITKEQAAAIIFQNGKIPAGAQLVPGKGNTWTVKLPNDADAIHNVVRHFNSHTETVITPPRQPNDVFPPDPIVTHTWVGGAPKTRSGPPPRADLFNDLGLVVTKHYKLDEGQRKPGSLGDKGHGYEVAFQKPMTKDEVQKKLFDERKIKQGEVRLVPMSPEPTTMWRVEIIGADAVDSFNKKALNALGDASVYTEASFPSGTPAGIKSNIENHTIPKDAKHFDPDVYVWEQDGYMMYVKSNNKGKDGYYDAQFTKMPNDENGRLWLRTYMVEQGMAPREAWQQFWADTVEVTSKELSMINNAYGSGPRPLKSGNPKSSFEEPHVPPSRSRMPNTPVAEPKVTIRGQKPPVSGNPPYVQPGRTPTIKNQIPPAPEPLPPRRVVQPHADAPAGQGGARTGADSQSPLPPQQPGVGKGKTLPGSLKKQGGPLDPNRTPEPEHSLPSNFPKKSGTKLSPQQVYQANDARRVGWSMTSAEHARQWKAANPGSNEPPPMAFTTPDGKVQVDEEQWVKSGQPALWGNRAGDKVSSPPPPPVKGD